MTEAIRHVVCDNANVATHANTLQPSRARSWCAMCISIIKGRIGVVSCIDLGFLLPMGLDRINGRTQLCRRMVDLVQILHRETVDSGEGLGEMFSLRIGDHGQVVDHVVELHIR